MESLNNDIRKYLRGEMTPAEMHALEQKALRDPFLAEALEGAEHAGADNFSVDIELLQRSISEKTSPRKAPKIISLNGWGLYMGIAAGLLLLAVSSFIVLTMIRQEQSTDMAISKTTAPAADSTEKKNSAPAETNEKTETRSPVGDSGSKDIATPDQTKPVTTGPVASSPEVAPVTLSEVIETEDQQIVEADLQVPPVISRSEARAKADREEASQKQSVAGAVRRSAVAMEKKNVRGRVVSADDGTVLPGVNVLIRGTNTGTVTDATGRFEIELPLESDALVLSMIGMASKEVRVSDTDIEVTMEPDVAQLSEMVVTGAGSQNADESPMTVELAGPVGGRRAFRKYLEENLRYPDDARAKSVEGRVTVQFTVQPNGELSNFRILKGIGYGCDEEMIRLIREGPAWTPSKKNNEPVTDDVTVRLKFDLPEKK